MKKPFVSGEKGEVMGREIELAKNTLILSLGSALPKVVHFIALPILTACLTKQEYGYYDLIATAVTLFLPTVTLQIQTAAFRYLIDYREKPDEQKKIITNIVVFVVLVSVLALGILNLILNRLDLVVRVGICCYFFVDMIVTMTRQIVRGLGKTQIYANSVMVESFFYIICIFVLVKWLDLGMEGALFSFVIGLVLSEVYISAKIRLIGYLDFKLMNKNVLMELIQYSYPMIPNSLSIWIMRLSDRFVISMVLGAEANAVYAVATKIPALYSVLQGTFTLAWQENASVASKDEDAETYYSNTFYAMYCIFFALMACLIAVTPILFVILVQGDYAEAYYQMPILYIGTFFSSLSAYLGGIYVAHKATKKVSITTIFAATCNLIIDILLVKKIGIFAGSISTAISYGIIVLYRMKDIQKIQRMSYKVKEMIMMLLILIVMAVFAFQKELYLDILNGIIAIVFSIVYNKQSIVAVVNMLRTRMKK